jgi:hypothetical protein
VDHIRKELLDDASCLRADIIVMPGNCNGRFSSKGCVEMSPSELPRLMLSSRPFYVGVDASQQISGRIELDAPNPETLHTTSPITNVWVTARMPSFSPDPA